MADTLCRFCQPIVNTILVGKDIIGVELGTYEVLLSTSQNCGNCKILLSQERGTNQGVLDPSTALYLNSQIFADSDYQIYDEDETVLSLDLIPMQPDSRERSKGILVDEQWIDLGRIRRWMEYCDMEHGETCRGFQNGTDDLQLNSLLLIDVIDECLVQAPFTTQYFALSYVWGKDTGAKALETNLKNVAAHRQQGSLAIDKGDIGLPETIKDAMRLVKGLEKRFLWVDRLCIIQDDFLHKGKQIEAMGAIYAHAYCTIVAAGGNDSHHGLRGVRNGSQPRALRQETLKFPAQNLECLIQRNMTSAERTSLWNTRGWTFQEKLMSRRCLVFLNDSVLWRCQRSIWREDMTADPEGVERPGLNQFAHAIFKSYAWPNLHQWYSAVVKYNPRNLAFESDRLPAIQGIEWALRQSFPGGFCYGLPEFFFDAALLWQPLEPATRRSGNWESEKEDEEYLPSWSWAGWHGVLDGKMSHFGRDFVRTVEQGLPGTTTTVTISPLVEWYQTAADGGKQRRIKNEYADWRLRAAKADNESIEQGWAKTFDEDKEKHYYTHPEAIPATFWWPVPISAGSMLPQTLRLPPYLTFRSSCASFVIDELLPNQYICKCMAVSLRDPESGAWAGMLRLNLANTAAIPTGQVVELIAISNGRAEQSADESTFLEEWEHSERPKSGPSYDFVNVLWVKRDRGWVTREALGRVVKNVWESQRLQEMDFKLR